MLSFPLKPCTCGMVSSLTDLSVLLVATVMVSAVDDSSLNSLAPLPLSVLWQELDQVIRSPELLSMSPLFQVMLQAIAPLPLSEQLAVAGLVFDQLAGVVSTRSTLLMESWESWHRPTDPVLDFSRDADLFVQSQRLELSDLIDTTPEPVFYPFQRQPPTVRGNAFESEPGEDSPDDWSDLLAPGSRNADCPVVNLEPPSEASVMESIKALSHGENIPLWSAQVSAAMQSLVPQQRSHSESLPLLALQHSLQVPLVEVWLALLLGDSGYQLTRAAGEELPDFHAWSEAFYSGATLQVTAAE